MPKYYTYRRNTPGEKFRRGRGYYAGPPRPFIDPELKIQAEADRRVQAAIDAMRSPIEGQRKLTAGRNERDLQAILEMEKALMPYLQGIGPGIQEGYNAAAQEISGLAGGYSAATADRVRAAQDASRQFVEGAAKGSDPSQAPDPTQLQDTLYGLGGYIPSASLAEQGAAGRRWGESLPAIEAANARNAYLGEMASARDEDKEYEQQLLDLARKQPELRDQILDELRKREADKVQARLSERQVRVQERAQDLYEDQFGEDKRATRAKEKLEWAGLGFQTKKAMADAKAAVAAAEEEGRQVDAAASALRGIMVDQFNRPILGANGKPIKVKKDPVDSKLGPAIQEARDLRGSPMKNPKKGRLSPGIYLARPDAKGVFRRPGFPPTTNDPKKAQMDGASGYTFVEAQQYLMDVYGINRAQARRALIRAGWKPDGVRPK